MQQKNQFGAALASSAPDEAKQPGTRLTEHSTPETVALGAQRRLWRRRRRAPKGSRLSPRRLLLAGLSVIGGLGVLAAVGVGVTAVRLAQGPIAVDWLAPRIKAALDERLKPGYSFELGETQLEKGAHGPAVTIAALKLKDPAGRVLLTAPKAAVAVNGLAAAVGQIVPTRLELTGLDVLFAVAADGAISVSAGGAEGLRLALPAAAPANPPPAADARESGPAPKRDSAGPVAPARVPPLAAQAGPVTTMARALQSLLDAISDPNSQFGALDHFSISGGRLVFDDRAAGERTVLEGLEVKFDKTGSFSELALLVKGPDGDWSLSAQSDGRIGEQRSLHAEIRDISLDEIQLAAGMRSKAVESDMPISASLNVLLKADGDIAGAQAKFAFGAGFLKSDNPEQAPWQVDEITGALALDAGTGRINFSKLRLEAGQTHVELQGQITPPASAAGDWLYEFAAADSVLAPEQADGAPLVIKKGGLAARYSPAQGRLALERLEIEGADFGLGASAELAKIGTAPTLRLDAALRRMPVHAALRLWPGFIAPQTRAWFLQHMHGGVMDSGAIKLDYDAATLVEARARRPLPDAAGRFDFAITGAALDTLPGIPAFTGVDGAGRVTGRTATFTATRAAINLGAGKKLAIPDAVFSVRDTEAKPAPATLALHLQGSIDALDALMAREALKNFHVAAPDGQSLKGQVDAQVTIDLKLARKLGPEDIAMRASGNVTGLSIDNFLGAEKLENAGLAVTIGKDGLRAKGDGRVFGAPATIDIKKPAGGAGEAVVSLTLDEAARARLGFSFGPGFAGPVTARVTSAVDAAAEKKARVELDLTRVAIEGLVPGWSKPAGKSGKASFQLQESGDNIKLDQIAFEAGGVSFGGAALFTREGKFVSARLNNLKLGAGEDMQLDASQSGEALKIALKGASVDARPFLSALLGQQNDGRGPRDMDVELRANTLIGHNKQSLANADIKASKRGGQLRSLAVTGRFGTEPVIISLVKKDGPAAIVARTQDAGAALSFLDLYRRMQGGTLDLTMRLGDGRQEGAVNIKDFTLKDEPAMARLVASGGAPSGPNSGQKPLDPASVPFTKMTASFARAGGRTDIRDGVMFGQQIGATMSGSIDFARNSVDLNGAFVPAYEINNLFARVPLFGPLLGGNKNEGLFAVNYRVTGQASAPILHVNPLSAIAPGFLRTIFGAVDGTRPLDAAGPVGDATPIPPR